MLLRIIFTGRLLVPKCKSYPPPAAPFRTWCFGRGRFLLIFTQSRGPSNNQRLNPTCRCFRLPSPDIVAFKFSHTNLAAAGCCHDPGCARTGRGWIGWIGSVFSCPGTDVALSKDLVSARAGLLQFSSACPSWRVFMLMIFHVPGLVRSHPILTQAFHFYPCPARPYPGRGTFTLRPMTPTCLPIPSYPDFFPSCVHDQMLCFYSIVLV